MTLDPHHLACLQAALELAEDGPRDPDGYLTAEGRAHVQAALDQAEHDGPLHHWESMSEADWACFAASDWQPYVVTRGKNKGKQAWKHVKSGKISYEDPTKKEAAKKEADEAKRKAKEEATAKVKAAAAAKLKARQDAQAAVAAKKKAAEAEKAKAAAAKAKTQEKAKEQRRRAAEHIRDVVSGTATTTPAKVKAAGAHLLNMTATELRALKSEIGAKGGGAAKAGLVAAITERALAARKAGKAKGERPIGSESQAPQVSFVPHPNQRPDETTIMVDPARLDIDWQKDADYHLAPGQEGVKGRRQAVEAYLATGKPVQASRVVLGADGVPSFTDGRHRFAVLRDKGVKAVALTVPKAQVREFQTRYGVAAPKLAARAAKPVAKPGPGKEAGLALTAAAPDNPLLLAMVDAEPDFLTSGAAVGIGEIRAALPGVPKDQLDRAMLDLIDRGVLMPIRHNFPDDPRATAAYGGKAGLLADGKGNYFARFALDDRTPEGKTFGAAADPKFTGTDALGRKWVNGKLVAKEEGSAGKGPDTHQEYTASDGSKVRVPAYDEDKVPADFALPDERAILDDVAEAVNEQTRKQGYAAAADVYDAVKAKHPDLDLHDFHRQLLAWGARGLVAPQRLENPSALTPDQLAKSPALVSDDPANVKRANVVAGTLGMVPGWQEHAPDGEPAVPSARHDAALLGAVKTLDAGTNLVPLTRLRQHLAGQGLSRAEQDAAIDRLYRGGKISLVPDDGRHGSTAEQRQAQYTHGGERFDHVALKPAGPVKGGSRDEITSRLKNLYDTAIDTSRFPTGADHTAAVEREAQTLQALGKADVEAVARGLGIARRLPTKGDAIKAIVQKITERRGMWDRSQI
jgi:hypothetical protein